MGGRRGSQEREVDVDKQVVGLEEKRVRPIQSLLLSSWLCEVAQPQILFALSLQAISSCASFIQRWSSLPPPTQDEPFPFSLLQVLLSTSSPWVLPQESSLLLFSSVSQFSLDSDIHDFRVTCHLPAGVSIQMVPSSGYFYSLSHLRHLCTSG